MWVRKVCRSVCASERVSKWVGVVERMPVLYGFICRGQRVLVEYATCPGNFPTVTRALLADWASKGVQDHKCILQFETYNYMFLREDDLVYVGLAPQTDKTFKLVAFVEAMSRRFLAEYTAEQIDCAPAFGMAAFAATMAECMTAVETDKLSDVKAHLNEVKECMIVNIGTEAFA